LAFDDFMDDDLKATAHYTEGAVVSPRRADQTQNIRQTTGLMQRGVAVWDAAGFLGMSTEALPGTAGVVIPTSCTAQQMRLHPSTGFWWLNRP
jgi:hypothetical protein